MAATIEWRAYTSTSLRELIIDSVADARRWEHLEHVRQDAAIERAESSRAHRLSEAVQRPLKRGRAWHTGGLQGDATADVTADVRAGVAACVRASVTLSVTQNEHNIRYDGIHEACNRVRMRLSGYVASIAHVDEATPQPSTTATPGSRPRAE